MKAKVLVTQKEYAEHVGVTPQAVSQMKQHGRIVMVGRFVDQEASDRLLSVRAAGAKSDIEGHDDEIPPLLLSKAKREFYAAEREEMRYQAEVASDTVTDERGRKLSKRHERTAPELDESDEHLAEVMHALVECGLAREEYQRGYADGVAAAVPPEQEDPVEVPTDVPTPEKPSGGIVVRFPDL